MIVVGKENDEFSKQLAKELGIEYSPIEHKLFPDNESYIRFQNYDGLKEKELIFVNRGESPNFNPDKLLIETLFTLKKLKGEYKSKIYCVLPYIPYARQDKKFKRGEVVSLREARDSLKEYSDLLINVSAHDFRSEGWVDEKTYNVDGTYAIIDFMEKQKYEKPLILAPDMTATNSVLMIAEALDAGTESLIKRRSLETGMIITGGKLPSLNDQELIIYDDIASTGNTLYKAVERGKEAGAKKIVCAVVHAVLTYNKDFGKNCLDLIREQGAEFYATDTIASPISEISIVPYIAKAIKERF
ncbi:MAG: ribose-phosphate diphosphokinase [Candidatus Aenigmarchaeota archaeon]|nr:ribose-phosphate diphosphokinase [Candidatus Aenigmarchaeota archaeon]